ncbi:TetR/AcrR family transcriptional regulator [Solicola sp. PLA-1-18]|uniref:TetR/AcrR family transcriptional regulator n=1 Tax=Solicola sp. PLA-1-18 TaxID=3380532 RepID=UPI003B7DBDCF
MTEVDQSPGRTRAHGAIVEAAAALLREGGPAAVTTRAVAAAAGAQPPTIYRLFGDKDGLLDAVAEHALATYVDTKVVGGEDPVAELAASWRTHVEFGLANPAVATLLADPARARTSPAGAAGMRVLRARVHRVASAGRLAVPEDRAVDMIHAAGTGLVLTLLATAPAERDLGLVDSVYEAVAAAILADGPATDADDVATAAITLRAGLDDVPVLTAAERALLADWLDRIAER